MLYCLICCHKITLKTLKNGNSQCIVQYNIDHNRVAIITEEIGLIYKNAFLINIYKFLTKLGLEITYFKINFGDLNK